MMSHLSGLRGRGHCLVEEGRLHRGGHEPDKGCRGNLTKRMSFDSKNSNKKKSFNYGLAGITDALCGREEMFFCS